MRKDWPVKKHLRNCVSAFGPAPRTQSSHRGHCPSNVSPDLANSLPEGPLRRTWSRCQPKVEAGAHVTNDPATPKARLSDRTTQYSTRQFSTGAVIFDPAEPRRASDSLAECTPLSNRVSDSYNHPERGGHCLNGATLSPSVTFCM